MHRILLFLSVFLLVTGCSPEQRNSAVSAASKSYLTSNRDGVIKNWQDKVSPSPACQDFKTRFKTAGERYDNAANGAFMNDMMKIWEATKTANCAAPENAAAQSFLVSQRDGVIRNWQAKVSTTPNCQGFRSQFKTTGEKHSNAANGAFVNDMMKIWEATKAANCAAPV